MSLLDSLISSYSKRSKRKTTKSSYYSPLPGETPAMNPAPVYGGGAFGTPPSQIFETPEPKKLKEDLFAPLPDFPTTPPNIPNLPAYQPPTTPNKLLGFEPYLGYKDFIDLGSKNTAVPTESINYGGGSPLANPEEIRNIMEANKAIYGETSKLGGQAKDLGLLPEDSTYNFRKGWFEGPDIVNPNDLQDQEIGAPTDLADAILSALMPAGLRRMRLRDRNNPVYDLKGNLISQTGG